jgi:hypothetical protein
MKTLLYSLLALAILPLAIVAKEAKEKAPSGYYTFDEIAKAQEKAKTSKKMIAVLAKGMNDNCPHCVTAMGVGQSTLRNDCVLVFTRAETLPSKTASLPEAAKSGLGGCPTGASVTFVVFNPEMTEMVAKIGRDQLENDRKAVAELKKTVSAAKKNYFASAAK